MLENCTGDIQDVQMGECAVLVGIYFNSSVILPLFSSSRDLSSHHGGSMLSLVRKLSSFCALTLLIGKQEGHAACKSSATTTVPKEFTFGNWHTPCLKSIFQANPMLAGPLFLQGVFTSRMPLCRPTNSVKALKDNMWKPS